MRTFNVVLKGTLQFCTFICLSLSHASETRFDTVLLLLKSIALSMFRDDNCMVVVPDEVAEVSVPVFLNPLPSMRVSLVTVDFTDIIRSVVGELTAVIGETIA